MAAQEAFNQSKEQLKEAKKQYDMIKVIDFEQWKNDKRQLKIPYEYWPLACSFETIPGAYW
mgnify:FL=1